MAGLLFSLLGGGCPLGMTSFGGGEGDREKSLSSSKEVSEG